MTFVTVCLSKQSANWFSLVFVSLNSLQTGFPWFLSVFETFGSRLAVRSKQLEHSTTRPRARTTARLRRAEQRPDPRVRAWRVCNDVTDYWAQEQGFNWL